MQLDAAAQMESELQAAVVNMLYSGQQTCVVVAVVEDWLSVLWVVGCGFSVSLLF
jgi:hypothetical protein